MKIAIFGAGGFGREVLSLIKNINSINQTFDVLGFIDDGIESGTQIHDLPVLGGVNDLERLQITKVVLAIGNPQIRKSIVEQLNSKISFPNIIHPTAIFQDIDRIKLGQGCIICAGNIFTTDVEIGDFCIINLSCTVGHDAKLGDFTSIMPGVNISGGAKLNSCVYVGTGAKLIKATHIGQGAVIGAGAVVDIDVPDHETVVGVPARPLKNKNEL